MCTSTRCNTQMLFLTCNLWDRLSDLSSKYFKKFTFLTELTFAMDY